VPGAGGAGDIGRPAIVGGIVVVRDWFFLQGWVIDREASAIWNPHGTITTNPATHTNVDSLSYTSSDVLVSSRENTYVELALQIVRSNGSRVVVSAVFIGQRVQG